MTSWCGPGPRVVLRWLSAFPGKKGYSLGYDSQPFAIHTASTAADQTVMRKQTPSGGRCASAPPPAAGAE
jgi:hypothetical protein